MRTQNGSRFCYLFIVIFGLVAILGGCHEDHSSSSADGITVTANSSFKDYVHFAVALNGNQSASFSFPRLQIYDRAGHLLYTGDNAQDNTSLLNGLDEKIHTLQSLPSTVPLSAVVELVPEFKAQEVAILHSGRPSVLAIFLEDCHACSIQEEALDNTQRRLTEHGMNILTIRVAK